MPEFSEAWKDYYKNLGAIFIHESIMPRFKELLRKWIEESLDHYYLDVWCDHLKELPCSILDIGSRSAATFNTLQE